MNDLFFSFIVGGGSKIDVTGSVRDIVETNNESSINSHIIGKGKVVIKIRTAYDVCFYIENKKRNIINHDNFSQPDCKCKNKDTRVCLRKYLINTKLCLKMRLLGYLN